MKAYSFKPAKSGLFSRTTTWYMYEDYVGEVIGKITLCDNGNYGSVLFDCSDFGRSSTEYAVCFDAASRRLKHLMYRQAEKKDSEVQSE